MKTTNNPTPHTGTDNKPSPVADKSVVRHVFTLGLDVDLRFVVTALQCDQGVIPPARCPGTLCAAESLPRRAAPRTAADPAAEPGRSATPRTRAATRVLEAGG